MIVDSSAVVTILLRQPGHEAVAEHLGAEPAVGIGSPTLAETGVVLSSRLGVAGSTLLARFVAEAELVVVSFGPEHAFVAIEAFRRFGKGRHSAGLNFGDCLTYATARVADEALLCLDADFAKTDLRLVL